MRALVSPVPFPDNPEQCTNGEVHDWFVGTATALLDTSQSTPTAVHVIHSHGVVKGC